MQVLYAFEVISIKSNFLFCNSSAQADNLLIQLKVEKLLQIKNQTLIVLFFHDWIN